MERNNVECEASIYGVPTLLKLDWKWPEIALWFRIFQLHEENCEPIMALLILSGLAFHVENRKKRNIYQSILQYFEGMHLIFYIR